MQDGVLIAQARRDWNLFVLDLVTSGKVMQINVAIVANVAINKHAMMTTGRGRPTHLVSRSKKVRIWHRRFGHTSNARIIRASKLLAGMGEFGTTYDQAEIYSGSKVSESEDVDAKPESQTPYELPKSLTPDQILTKSASLVLEPGRHLLSSDKNKWHRLRISWKRRTLTSWAPTTHLRSLEAPMHQYLYVKREENHGCCTFVHVRPLPVPELPVKSDGI